MDRAGFAGGVSHLTVHLVAIAADRIARHDEDDRRYYESERSYDHEDEPHGRETKAGSLIGDGPVHHCSGGTCDGAKHHSW